MKKLTAEQFIKRSNIIHNNEFTYLKVVYVNTEQKVIITCSKHGDFLQKPNKHMSGQKCPKCTNNVRLTIEQFIEKAYLAHGNIYDYSQVIYKNNRSNVIIICKSHGKFLQTPENHVSGKGCPQCGILKLYSNITSFILKSELKHGNKYDYSKSIYINANTKIEIICPLHGSFWQIPENHYTGGCIKCAAILRGKNLALTQEEFINKAAIIHNNIYNYSLIKYKNLDTKIEIICSKHGSFFQRPYTHLCGSKCYLCAWSAGTSKLEQSWLNSLNIPLENRQFKIKIGSKRIVVDGYDPQTNTVYEFNGDFWHGNPLIYNPNSYNETVNKTFGELYNKTIERENLLKTVGYNLVIKWETEKL